MSLLQNNYQQKLENVLSTGKKRSYFVAAVTVFFILVMSIAGIIPALSSLGVQHEENQKRDIIIGKLENKLNTLKNFVREQGEKESVINFLNKVFPDRFPEKDVLNKMVELEEKNNLNIESYIYNDPESGLLEQVNAYTSINTKVYSLSFTGEGRLTDIQNFIKDVENARRIFNLTEVVITRKVGDELIEESEGRDFNFSANLNFYYYDLTAKPVGLE